MVSALHMSMFYKKLKMALSSKMLVMSVVPLAVLLLFFSVISVVLYGSSGLIDNITFLAIYFFLSALSVNFVINNYQSELDDKSLKPHSSLNDFLAMRYSRNHDEKYKFIGLVAFPITGRQCCVLLSIFVFLFFVSNTALHFYN